MMVNQMVSEDLLVNQHLFKVSGKEVRFMELPPWFKIISPKVLNKKKQVFARFHQATQLNMTYLLLEPGKTIFTKEKHSQAKIAYLSESNTHSWSLLIKKNIWKHQRISM